MNNHLWLGIWHESSSACILIMNGSILYTLLQKDQIMVLSYTVHTGHYAVFGSEAAMEK